MINLKKGEQTNIGGSELRYGMVGLSWDVKDKDPLALTVDLDLAAFLVGYNGKVLRDEDFVFYNNLTSSTKALIHTGDERTGAAEGDDEIIVINFDKIPSDIEKIVFTATIDDYARKRQNFGKAENAVIRFVEIEDPNDPHKNAEKARFYLSEEYAANTCVVFCEVVRSSFGWKFRAVGDGYNADLAFLCRKFGLEV